MNTNPERRQQDAYAQAVEALHDAAVTFVPVFAEAETGIMMVLDIAGMGKVNARHGIAIGDRLLHAVEASLRTTLDRTGEVARLAGDQYLVVLPGATSQHGAVDCIRDAMKLAKVRGRWGQPVRVRAHIGVAVWQPEFPPQAALWAAGRALSKVSDCRRT